MNPALAASCVVAIFAVFLVLSAAIGTSTNSDEIGSLRWDLEYGVRIQIESLESEIESLSQDVAYDLQTEIGALQSEIESLTRDLEYIRITLVR